MALDGVLTKIENIKSNVSASYKAISDKGYSVPSDKKLENLPNTISDALTASEEATTGRITGSKSQFSSFNYTTLQPGTVVTRIPKPTTYPGLPTKVYDFFENLSNNFDNIRILEITDYTMVYIKTEDNKETLVLKYLLNDGENDPIEFSLENVDLYSYLPYRLASSTDIYIGYKTGPSTMAIIKNGTEEYNFDTDIEYTNMRLISSTRFIVWNNTSYRVIDWSTSGTTTVKFNEDGLNNLKFVHSKGNERYLITDTSVIRKYGTSSTASIDADIGDQISSLNGAAYGFVIKSNKGMFYINYSNGIILSPISDDYIPLAFGYSLGFYKIEDDGSMSIFSVGGTKGLITYYSGMYNFDDKKPLLIWTPSSNIGASILYLTDWNTFQNISDPRFTEEYEYTEYLTKYKPVTSDYETFIVVSSKSNNNVIAVKPEFEEA